MSRITALSSSSSMWRWASVVCALLPAIGVFLLLLAGSRIWNLVHALDALRTEQGQTLLVQELTSAGAVLESDTTCDSGRTVLLSWPSGELSKEALTVLADTAVPLPSLGKTSLTTYGVTVSAVNVNTVAISFASDTSVSRHAIDAFCP